MLEYRNVTVKRYNTNMLNRFNLVVEDGMLLGILGDNNLSKTLMLQAGAGTITPDYGDICLDGISVSKEYKKVSKRIGYMPDTYGFLQKLKVEEYFSMFLSLRKIYGRYQTKRMEEVLSIMELEAYQSEYIHAIPEEKKPFLYLAQIILHSPDWIFLDEPFANLSTNDRNTMARILLMLQEDGATIIVNSAMYPELIDLFTDVVVIEEGKLATIGHITDVYEKALMQKPVRMQVLDGMNFAVEVLKQDALVDRLTIVGNQVIFHFNGGEREEAELLSKLVRSGALVHNYTRDVLNLEEIFEGAKIR